MRLHSTASDSHTVDARTRDGARQAADTSSNDNSPPFDGVLANVQTEAKTAQGAPPETSKTQNVAAPPDTAKTPAVDPASESTIIGAFIGILGQGTGPASTKVAGKDPAQKDDEQAKSSREKMSGADAVDALLKRAVSEDDTKANAATNAVAATATAPSPDLMSVLLLGATLNKVPLSPPAAPSGGKAAPTTPVAGALDGSKTSPSTEPQATTDNAVLVSDISITSHLAPVTAPNAASPSQDTKSAPPKGQPVSGTPSLTQASTPHPQPEDALAPTSRHDSASSADALSAQPMSTTYAAVRSIATAIGDLAARTAPTVATTEASKAALGPARTMTLQMNPADLGTVDIRMHMTGQTLDVQLTISKAETLGMVSRERDTLANALGDQNYQLNSLVIQDGGAAASSGGQNATTQGDTSGSNARADRQGGETGSDTSGGRQPGHDAERSTRDSRRQTEDNPAARPKAMSGDGTLYV